MKINYKKILTPLLALSILSACHQNKKESLEPSKNESNVSTDEFVNFAVSEFASEETSDNRIAAIKPKPKSICGAKVTKNATITGLAIRLSFDGTMECEYGDQKITKQGEVFLQLTKGTKWSKMGSQISITFNQYKVYKQYGIENPKDSLLGIFNGTVFVSNLTGGLVNELDKGEAPIVHEVKSDNLKVDYDNRGLLKTMQNILRRETATNVGGDQIEVKVTGTKTINGIDNIATWGKTSSGADYYGRITAPIVYNTCNSETKAISGFLFYKKGTVEISETYGVNNSGIPVNNCTAYGFKQEVKYSGGATNTKVIKY